MGSYHQAAKEPRSNTTRYFTLNMASVIYTFLLLSLIGVIAPDSSFDVSSDRVPCGRCVHPPCGRCGLTLVRGGPKARQTTTTLRPFIASRPTQRTTTTRRPTRPPPP